MHKDLVRRAGTQACYRHVTAVSISTNSLIDLQSTSKLSMRMFNTNSLSDNASKHISNCGSNKTMI